MNRYYLVAFSLLTAFACLVILGFILPQFPFRVAVLGIASIVLKYLIFAGIGYGAYFLARKRMEQIKAVVIGAIVAVAAFFTDIILFTFLLLIVLG
jgi:hypothetical protein